MGPLEKGEGGGACAGGCSKCFIFPSFTAGICSICLHLHLGTFGKPLSLGIFRSDYMVHQNPSDPGTLSLKQVEFNTCAGGVHSGRVSKMHR